MDSEDPDEMLHINAAFYLGLHRLNMVKKALQTQKSICFIYNLTPYVHDVCKMDYPSFFYQKEESISLQRFKSINLSMDEQLF